MSDELFEPYDPEKHKPGQTFIVESKATGQTREGQIVFDSGSARLGLVSFMQSCNPENYLFGPAIPGPAELAAMRQKAEMADQITTSMQAVRDASGLSRIIAEATPDSLILTPVEESESLAAMRRDAEALRMLEGMLYDGVKRHGWLNAPPVAVSIVAGGEELELEDVFFINGKNGSPTLADAIRAAGEPSAPARR